MPNPAFGGSMGQKINWSRVNLTSTTWFAGTLNVSVPPVANDICRSAFSLQNIFRNGVPLPSCTTTPLLLTNFSRAVERLIFNCVNCMTKSRINHGFLTHFSCVEQWYADDDVVTARRHGRPHAKMSRWHRRRHCVVMSSGKIPVMMRSIITMLTESLFCGISVTLCWILPLSRVVFVEIISVVNF